MWNVIICGGDAAEQGRLTAYIRLCCNKTGSDVRIEECADWPALARKVKHTEPDLVVVVQDGVEGLDTITSARLLAGKIIWFSDLDFGVQAYRLCVSYFCRKPVTYQKVERAVARYMETIPPARREEFSGADL